MNKKYTLVLNGTENEQGVTEARVIEYAKNRVLANVEESIEDVALVSEKLDKIVFHIASNNEEVVASNIEDNLEFLLESLQCEGSVTFLSISEAIKEVCLDGMGLNDAKNIISIFDEEVEVYTGDFKFKFLDCYRYSHIDALVEMVNEGVGSDDYETRLEIETFGNEVVGEWLVVVESPDTGKCASFVLSGGTGGGYLMRCVCLTPDYSVDGEYHS